MQRVWHCALACWLALGAACAGGPTRSALPEYDFDAPAPELRPTVTTASPRLVSYQDSDVAYVTNAEGDVYRFRGIFYTFFNGSWFFSQNLRGPWKFMEMKYVPADLFKVRGTVPAGVR